MIIKSLFSVFSMLLIAGSLCAIDTVKSSDASKKEAIIWLSIESPPQIWEYGYGKAFPADYMLKAIADAGFTDIEFETGASRGPIDFYHNTKVEHATRCPRMGDREWLEEALAAADKYNLKIWLILTPDYKVKGTDIAGLNDPRHIKIWTDIIEEFGKNYKPRHESLAGIYLHELDCAEAPDTHSKELEKFNLFCQKNFGEAYDNNKMPDGKGNTKWDKRFCLYKIETMTNFVKIMRDTAARYDMKTAFCLYPPEITDCNPSSWGYDAVAIEKIVDRMWVVVQSEYRDLKKVWLDSGLGYRGVNMPYRQAMAFHGKPIGIFESRVMLFPDIVRKYYSMNESFTKVYGDVLNGYYQKSERMIDLFLRVENVKKWNKLQKEWMGAESQSKIAVMATSVPLVLRFPAAPGVTYRKVFTSLLDDLKKRYSVDAQLIGTEFTLKPENLAKYDLLIIPEEMGIGMDEAFLNSLKNYLAKGGKVLALGTPITTGGSDLEKQTDHMEELFGIKIKDAKPLPGYIALESPNIPVPKKKTWCELRDIKVTSAEEVVIRDKFTKKPVMTRKGNAYYLACGYSEGKSKLISDFIDKIVPQPACLNENDNFRFSSMTRNNDMLCVALPCEKAASATLSIDAGKLGLKGDKFEVKNIITGKTLYAVTADELKKGVKVKTDYDSEPYVLAIGASNDLAQFKGLYPDNKVFVDMGKINIVENPEVAIAVPDKPGIKVGIYQNSYGAEAIYNQLRKLPEFNCFYLPRLDSECMGHADVLIIPQPRADVFFDGAKNEIREMVKQGKGLILTHDSAVRANELFPSVADANKGKIMKVDDNKIKIQAAQPVTAGLKDGDEYLPGFGFDHYALAPGKDAQVIAKDVKGNDVILAGKFGKGKVVLFGTLPGEFTAWNDPTMLQGKELGGKELQILADSVRWLAGDKK